MTWVQLSLEPTNPASGVDPAHPGSPELPVARLGSQLSSAPTMRPTSVPARSVDPADSNDGSVDCKKPDTV